MESSMSLSLLWFFVVVSYCNDSSHKRIHGQNWIIGVAEEVELKEHESSKAENTMLPELETNQDRQVFRSVYTYAMNNCWIRELFSLIFCKTPCCYSARAYVAALDGDWKQCGNKQMMYEMSVSTLIEAQVYFHAMILMSREVNKKKVKIVRNVVDSTLLVMSVQPVKTTWARHKKFCSYGQLWVVMELYTELSPAMIQFQVFLNRSDSFVSLKEN